MVKEHIFILMAASLDELGKMVCEMDMAPIFLQKGEKYMPDGTGRGKDMVRGFKLFQTEESMLVNGRTE